MADGPSGSNVFDAIAVRELRAEKFGLAAAAVASQSAYTQTYATADKTQANLTVGADLGAFTDPPSAAEMAALRTFVNALKADLTDIKQITNSIIDDLQTLGIVL